MTSSSVDSTSSDKVKANPGRYRLVKLQHILAEKLDEHELRLLCFQLGIDVFYLPGEGKDEKTKAMLDLLHRQTRIPELVRTLFRLHPEIPWKKLLNISRYPVWIRRLPVHLNKSLPVISLLVFVAALFAIIPISSANWNEVLGITGEMFTGYWVDSNCTYSQGYWKQHPEVWPVDGLIIGEVNYLKEDALLVLDTPPQGDATFILAHQLIAAKLNILNGAEPGFIEQTILDADGWLAANPLGTNPENPEREVGIALAEVLEMYNTGEIGPGMCSEGGGGNISSIAIFFELPATGDDPSDLDFSATPIGMLPELPGIPGTGDTPEQVQNTPYSSGSGPPSTPEATQPDEPTQSAEPPQVDLNPPTLAPTMNPNDGLTTTPGEGVAPSPTMAPSPTLAPTLDNSPRETEPPTEPPQPTPTIAPTAYTGPPGCTQPLEYWTKNLDSWILKEFNFAEEEYDVEGALDILLVNPQGDATYILAKQYITAQLNITAPADPTAIIDLMDRAKIWFNTHPIGSEPKNPDRKEGLELAAMLESYNLGLLGPGPCVQPSPTPIPTPTPTSTSIPGGLSMPTSAPTMAPTFIPTPLPVDPTEALP